MNDHLKEGNTGFIGIILPPDLQALGKKYAELTYKKQELDKQLATVKSELIDNMKLGDKIMNPEYTISVSNGRITTSWICKKEAQRRMENELVERGFMVRQEGKPYVMLRFRKAEEVDYE